MRTRIASHAHTLSLPSALATPTARKFAPAKRTQEVTETKQPSPLRNPTEPTPYHPSQGPFEKAPGRNEPRKLLKTLSRYPNHPKTQAQK